MMNTIGRCARLAVVGSVLLTGVGCGGQDDATPATDAPPDPRTMTLEELAARTRVPGQADRYVVEGDMMLSYDDLTIYYENRTLKDKAIVTQVVNDSTGAVFDATRSNPTNIRYCLTGGWGGTEAVKADVVATMASATAWWTSVANVRFSYVSSEDGAGCTQSIVGSTVDFIVKPNVGSANSSYAWWQYATVQELAVGGNLGQNLPIMTHELGHVLGLDHEGFHNSAGLGCAEPNYGREPAGFSWGDQRELTSWDSVSIMGYYLAGAQACPGTAGAGTPADQRISVLDGVGVRSLYGNPTWWGML